VETRSIAHTLTIRTLQLGEHEEWGHQRVQEHGHAVDLITAAIIVGYFLISSVLAAVMAPEHNDSCTAVVCAHRHGNCSEPGLR
jgi:hypothetical protein